MELLVEFELLDRIKYDTSESQPYWIGSSKYIVDTFRIDDLSIDKKTSVVNIQLPLIALISMSGEVGVKVEVGGCQAVEDHAQSNHERKKEHFWEKLINWGNP